MKETGGSNLDRAGRNDLHAGRLGSAITEPSRALKSSTGQSASRVGALFEISDIGTEIFLMRA